MNTVDRKRVPAEWPLWGLLALVAVGVAVWAAVSKLSPPAPLSRNDLLRDTPVAEFQLTDQLGRPVTNADLAGKVWIAGFVFTRCPFSCPKLSEAFGRLQHQLRHPAIRLLAFSVDPEHDTPEVLLQYARAVQADPERWQFLTGEQRVIDDLIERSFLARPSRNPDATDPGLAIAHSNRLMLVDAQGKVRGSYLAAEEVIGADGSPTGTFEVNEAELRRLRRDAQDLAVGGPIRLSLLPTVNATLNGVAAVLLLAGYVLIRRKQVIPHVVLMLAAVLVSTLFLASYLYYHFKQGSMPFTGQGFVRPVYFAILLTHTILAAAVPPLVLWSLYHAARRRFDRHIKIARWTFPIWLYVSVTGVIIYLMLYHLYPS